MHPLCPPLPVESNGPFADLAEERLMTLDLQRTRLSQDDGQTWSEARSIAEGLDGLRDRHVAASIAFAYTESSRCRFRDLRSPATERI